MKRRTFVQLLLALAGLPLVAKAKQETHVLSLAECPKHTCEPLPVATLERPGAIPVGAVSQYYGEKLPDGWLWCDGAPISRSYYPELMQVLQHPDFNTAHLPDFPNTVIKAQP